MMNRVLMLASVAVVLEVAAETPRTVPEGCDPGVMSEAYRRIWNDDEQAALDAAIFSNRTSEASVTLPVAEGTEVEVEQLTHEFVFGANSFTFDQFERPEWNEAYRGAWGPKGVFNSATVAFYWDRYEPYPGVCRDGQPEADERVRYWRRPAPAPVIDYMKEVGARVHGHILIWGLGRPHWIWNSYCPESEKLRFAQWDVPRGRPGKFALRDAWRRVYNDLSEEEIAARAPEYVRNQKRLFRERIAGVAARFGDLVDSWDVVNESSEDWELYGTCKTGKAVCSSRVYGLLPGDYALDALLEAKRDFPPHVKLNINDWNVAGAFQRQVRDLERHGARIDIVGCQMHIFDTNVCARLAQGDVEVGGVSGWVNTPGRIRSRLDMIAETGRPIHISEVTIAAPGATARDLAIQAELTRNIYRAWFAHPKTMGVTWWNLVDGGGAAGEPKTSGLFTRELKRKPAYAMLDQLVNREWKTRTRVKAAADGGTCAAKFRGFRGNYRLSWRCPRCGERHTAFMTLTRDGAENVDTKFVCNVPVRAFVVDGKEVTLAAGEKTLDLAAIYPDAVTPGRDGSRTAQVAFTLVAPADGEYELLRFSDWYGRWTVNGGLIGDLNGPSVAADRMTLRLAKGENRIEVASRAGRGGRWLFSVQLPSGSPLELR